MLRLYGNLACSAGEFRTRECTFSHYAAILHLITVKDWGEDIFPKGVGVKDVRAQNFPRTDFLNL